MVFFVLSGLTELLTFFLWTARLAGCHTAANFITDLSMKSIIAKREIAIGGFSYFIDFFRV
ncbi:MAG: hypothetical protein D3909_19000 [Candidatus Electrothrix sp. ATG1]|nr:hypothetical protein [Candidatus Electrothrix sp. ATG1]